MSPDESESLRALVGSLSKDVQTLTRTVPDVYISRKEHDRITQRIRLAFVIILLLLCLAALIFFTLRNTDKSAAENRERLRIERQEDLATATDLSEDAIARNTCALKGILEAAQSSAVRNPIPPGLDEATRAFVEQSRANADAFYKKHLADMNATLTDLGRTCPPSPLSATSG